ncbi:MAG: hypothetical protein M3065_07475 [Actinomycetota bacterium]|nr:hypothetical protein [Actinomycetota bacterium]
MRGESQSFEGVRGVSHNKDHGGVVGICDNPAGTGGTGVFGSCDSGAGISGQSATWIGVFGESQDYEGVRGVSHNKDHGGVVGICDSASGGTGVYGKCDSGLAGWFDGDVAVSRQLIVYGDVICPGADLAEQFGVVGELVVEPGCVVVLVGDDRVRLSDKAYDHRVAGVVSGAGSHRPAMVLDKRGGPDRQALALTGKVWCNAEADSAPIGVGDLLTTSSTPGYAMRASDPSRAFGAVIGKALGSLESGRGLVPVLVALQ